MPRLDRAIFGLAMIAALAAGLALAGCGRKGALEPPPSAAINPPPAQAAASQPRYDAAGRPIPPQGQRKTFVLDWLLN